MLMAAPPPLSSALEDTLLRCSLETSDSMPFLHAAVTSDDVGQHLCCVHVYTRDIIAEFALVQSKTAQSHANGPKNWQKVSQSNNQCEPDVDSMHTTQNQYTKSKDGESTTPWAFVLLLLHFLHASSQFDSKAPTSSQCNGSGGGRRHAHKMALPPPPPPHPTTHLHF